MTIQYKYLELARAIVLVAVALIGFTNSVDTKVSAHAWRGCKETRF